MAEDNKIIAELQVTGVDKFKRELQGALTEADKVTAAVKGTGDASTQAVQESTQAFTSYKSQLKTLRAEITALTLDLAEMKDAGKQGTQEFTALEKKITDLTKKAGQLNDAIQDVNQTTRDAGSDTRGLDRAIRVVGSATAAFQIFEGAAAVAGKSNEDLQKALVKLNGVMAITQGLQQIQNELTKNDSVFKGLASGATKLYTAAQNALARATGLVKVALAGLGIGAVIGLIYGAVQAYKAFTGQTEELADATERLRKEQEKQNEALQEEIKYRVNLGEITAKQGAEEALAAAKKEQVAAQKNLNSLLAEEQNLINRISDSEGQTQLLSDLKQLQAQIPNAKKLFNEASDAVNAAQKELDGYKEKTKEAKDETDKASKSTLNWRDTIRRVIQALGQSSQPMTDAIRLFKEYNTGVSKTAQEATRAAEEIAAAQKRIQDSVSGGNVTRATGAGTRQDELAESFQKAQDYYTQIQGVITQTSQLIQNATAIRAEQEIQTLENKRRRGLISEKQYEREVAKIKNEQAQKQRRADIINAFALIPQAVLNAYVAGSKFSPAIGAVFAGIAGAFATAQAALVAAAPVPKFFKGVIDLQSARHPNGIDTVPAMLTKGESVMTVSETKKYKKELMAIRKGVFHKIYMPKDLAGNPVINMQGKVKEREDYRLYENLATIGSYMKSDYKANERANQLLVQLIETSKPKNRNA